MTARDEWWSAAVMIGGTAVLALAWMGLHVKFHDNPYVDAFSVMPFLAAGVLSMPFTYLKGRPAASQAMFVALNLAFLVALFLLVGFLTPRI